jgi:hypothetical protein
VCVYTTPITAKTKNGDLLVEAIQLLNSLTPSQVTVMVSSLRSTEDPAIVINSLRQATEAADQAYSGLTSSSIRPSSFVSGSEVKQHSRIPTCEDAHSTDISSTASRVPGSLSVDSSSGTPQQLSSKSAAMAGEFCAGYDTTLHGMREEVRKCMQPMSR